MGEIKAPDHKAVMAEIRGKLKLKRGYGGRIAGKLNIDRRSVYNVAWGRTKDAKILKALINEVKTESKNPFEEIITEYLNEAA